MITGQHFQGFDALVHPSEEEEDGDEPFPYVDLDRAGPEGSYAQFFEQALEWNQTTYTLYPYFWGKRDRWLEALGAADVDAQFEAFLQAGAARVVVPVRPGYDDSLLAFLEFGWPEDGSCWPGGGVPHIGDPGDPSLYVSIADELREQSDAADGKPVGEPWAIRVPTILVLLPQGAEP
jgi:hypothetical protein